MSEKVEGFIGKLTTKEGSGKQGPWAVDNILLQTPENDDIGWFGLGFRENVNVAPKLKEGDYIQAEWEQEGTYKNIVKGSGKIMKNAPARAQTTAAGGKVTQSGRFGEIGGYNTESDIARMTYANARDHAIRTVEFLYSADALPINKTQGEAAKKKRFEQLTAVIDKMTVEFFNDSTGELRKLSVVADGGIIDTSPDVELPDVPEENVTSQDAPPPDDDDGSF